MTTLVSEAVAQERLIILTGWEARGLHEGRISLLWRLMRADSDGHVTRRECGATYFITLHPDGLVWTPYGGAGLQPVPLEVAQKFCPFGSPGDRLACREGYSLQSDCDCDDPPFSDGRPIRRWIEPESGNRWTQPHYRATDRPPDLCCEFDNCKCCAAGEPGPHWRSPATMPRWAVRTVLSITEVQVRQVQSITVEEARAAGCQPFPEDPVMRSARPSDIGEFMIRWDNSHKPGQRWGDNPWCWALWVRRIA